MSRVPPLIRLSLTLALRLCSRPFVETHPFHLIFSKLSKLPYHIETPLSKRLILSKHTYVIKTPLLYRNTLTLLKHPYFIETPLLYRNTLVLPKHIDFVGIFMETLFPSDHCQGFFFFSWIIKFYCRMTKGLLYAFSY